ncbi:SPASM domain-containing protein [Streptomyces sp. NPDC020983]|uniref:SPASM domain-containing protein n=1 Tax=Streptomyces sp. NPDC020983 TaxID=3365106 RepID=UPI0037ADC3FA
MGHDAVESRAESRDAGHGAPSTQLRFQAGQFPEDAGRSRLAPDLSGLCGDCGNGKAAVGPDGTVSPCVFSTFLDVGNVRTAPLADILGGAAMTGANAVIRETVPAGGPCRPDSIPCSPDNAPRQPCGPEDNAECSPGTPPSTCNPRR